MARYLACLIYRLMTKGQAWIDRGEAYFEQKKAERELRTLQSRAQKMGLQPQPVPPIYQPEPFAEAVVRCCERPVRELPVGWGAQKLLWGQKLSPRAGDTG